MRATTFLAACGLTLALGTGVAVGDSITALCQSGGRTSQCSSAWYTSPVTVTWETDSPVTSTTGCSLNQNYAYAVDQMTKLSCEATWGSGSQAISDTYSFWLNLEVSAPTAVAVPSRPPDAGGWYNHAVAVSFTGSAFSGLVWCAAPQTYGGPNTVGVVLAGSCTDNAGKTASATFPLRYDATPPTVTLSANPGDQTVGVSWQASSGPAPLASVQLVRSPGQTGAAPSVVSSTPPSGVYQDARVRNRIRYTYTVTATDQAGNTTVRSVVVTPGPRLISPAAGARVGRPPMLSWTPVPKATYYNVQLFRGRKILTAWPKQAHLQLKRSWRFDRRGYRLRPGRYRWYVWPGFGRRSASRYGARVGSGTFVVT